VEGRKIKSGHTEMVSILQGLSPIRVALVDLDSHRSLLNVTLLKSFEIGLKEMNGNLELG
jgi:hypothetical protein